MCQCDWRTFNHHRASMMQGQHPSPGLQDTQYRICVFTPSPLYTITIENGADEQPEVHFHAGGQGFWVARMVTNLAGPALLCGPFGGEPGRVLRSLIEAENVRVRAVPSQGANGGYIHDRRSGQRQVVVEVKSAPLTRHEVDDLYNATLASCLRAEIAVLTGPSHDAILAADLYRRLSHDLQTNDCRVVADLSGDALAAALQGGVYFLKVSEREVIEAGYAQEGSVNQLRQGAQRLHDQGAQNVLISRAEAPAMALVEGRFFEVAGPRFAPLEYRGPGDSMTAALAVGLSRGLELEALLQFATAAGALNVTRHGLGTGQQQNIADITPRVEVRPLPDAS
jgi:1-phosphofructokinase